MRAYGTGSRIDARKGRVRLTGDFKFHRMLIYHIVEKEVWDALESELYSPVGLEREGFIHCSFKEQLSGVIERYYARGSELAVLEIDPQYLMSRVVNEPSTNEEIYPHIYGQINLSAVVAVEYRIA